MTDLKKRILDYIANGVQYVLIVIILCFALQSWREGLIEAAILFGGLGVGSILLSVLLHTCKVTGSIRRCTYVCSVALIALGVYSLVIGSIYDGIFVVLIGMNFLFMEILKGKWVFVGCTVVLVLAVGILIVEETNDGKRHAIGKEQDVQRDLTDSQDFHACGPPVLNNITLCSG